MDPKEEEQLSNLCSDLIQINSCNPPGDENVMANYCLDYLAKYGFETEIISHSPNRRSLLASFEGRRETPTHIFLGHLDTVPVGEQANWSVDPFKGRISAGRIWGRGAADMKGGLASLLFSARVLKNKNPSQSIVMGFTADEESTCLGARSMVNHPLFRKCKFLYIPEPTNNQIAIAEKGAIWVRIRSIGKSAHASMPQSGVNAIEKMVKIINALSFKEFIEENHPLLGKFSAGITTIMGGIKTNVIPESCDITLDIRNLPSQDQNVILSRIRSELKELANEDDEIKFEVEMQSQKPAIETHVGHKDLGEVLEIAEKVFRKKSIIGVNYYSDAAEIVKRIGMPFILCGPGETEQAHRSDESLPLTNLFKSCEFYQSILTRLI